MRILAAVLVAAAIAAADPCASCGADQPADSNFCSKCGAALGAGSREVEEARRAADRKKDEYIDALEVLRKALDAAGDSSRAADIAAQIQMLRATDLSDGSMPDGSVGVKAGTKSIKEANDLFESAKLYMSTRNPAKRGGNLLIAIDKLREITEKHSESDKIVDAWYSLGDCYRDGYVRRYDDAIKAFDRVKDLDPKNSSDSRLLAGKLADNLGRYDDAYARYADAIEHDSNSRNVEWAKARRIQLEPYLKK